MSCEVLDVHLEVVQLCPVASPLPLPEAFIAASSHEPIGGTAAAVFATSGFGRQTTGGGRHRMVFAQYMVFWRWNVPALNPGSF